ncbi:MAG: hypothetical protein J7M40_10375 [Planctomycetes bacterium]|nr:hypothetical protein [Planctomycetota bacterium]
MLRRFLLTISVISVFAHGCKADTVEVNLARGKRYTFSPKPNYTHCTDSGDVSQLTDGRSYESYWVKKSTVGWDRTGTIEITIDLGGVFQVDRVAIHSTGGGRADMEYPKLLVVSVSAEGRRFGVAGLIKTDGITVGSARKEPHVFKIGGLNVKAGYVKVLVRSQGKFHRFFTDEIEVYGRKGAGAGGYRNASELTTPLTRRELLDGIEEYFQIARNVEQIDHVVRAGHIKLSEVLDESLYDSYRKYVGMFAGSGTEFADLKTLKGIHERIGLIKAGILKYAYGKQLLCYSTDPMEMLLEKEMPSLNMSNFSGVEVFQWRNEYESAAINVVNCSQQQLQCRISISPLSDKQGVVRGGDDVITIRRAVYVRAMDLGLVADALVLQQNKAFTLKPGKLTQIWLTIDSSRLSSGSYSATIAVVAGDSQLQTVPLSIEVAPLRFPDKVALKSCVWDQYITSSKSFIRTNPGAAIKDLTEHYVNVGVIHPAYIPYPGKHSVRMQRGDFVKLDKQLELRKNYDRVLLFLDADNYLEKKIQGEWMSELWKAGFAEWLRQIVSHMSQRGFDYSRFALYPYDEKIHDKFYQLAKLIKQVDPRVRIYCNWLGKGPKDFMRFKGLIDIWCPPQRHCSLNPDWMRAVENFNKEMWTYGVTGPKSSLAVGKAKDPYTGYRLAGWRAFERGYSGAGFWVYLDWQSQPGWDDTDEPVGYYRVIYDGKLAPKDSVYEPVVTSRRWEAWREGVEDYQHLYCLKEAIYSAKGEHPGMAGKAMDVLERQVGKVLGRHDDRDAVYQARRTLSDMLLMLNQL